MKIRGDVRMFLNVRLSRFAQEEKTQFAKTFQNLYFCQLTNDDWGSYNREVGHTKKND